MRLPLDLTLIAGLALIGGGPARSRLDAVWVERETAVMGTTLHALVAAPSRDEGVRASERAFAAVRRVDDLLSTWRDDSELARLNRATPGAPVVLSADLWTLLDEARRWSGATDGAFDPGVGALVDAWDLRGAGRHPDAAALAAARAATGLAHFDFEPATRVARRDAAAAWLDSGGFGKGAALRLAARALDSAGVRNALLNFGGQVLAIGAPVSDPDGAGAWTVTVAHPSRRSEVVAALRLRDGSAATSSQSERSLDAAGGRIGHLLDPRTGRPVPAWGSVTVVAADAAVADILSTALFVLGPIDGLRWARARTDVAALFLVERDGVLDARCNRAMTKLLVQDPELPLSSCAGD